MFLLRVKKLAWAKYPAIFFLCLGIPTAVIACMNLIDAREWWLWVFPFLFVTFCVYSLIYDYILKVNFRNPKKLAILVPYLLLYYIGLILMWGLTWSIGVFYGAITGITYFLQLFGAAYAGKKGVG